MSEDTKNDGNLDNPTAAGESAQTSSLPKKLSAEEGARIVADQFRSALQGLSANPNPPDADSRESETDQETEEHNDDVEVADQQPAVEASESHDQEDQEDQETDESADTDEEDDSEEETDEEAKTKRWPSSAKRRVRTLSKKIKSLEQQLTEQDDKIEQLEQNRPVIKLPPGTTDAREAQLRQDISGAERILEIAELNREGGDIVDENGQAITDADGKPLSLTAAQVREEARQARMRIRDAERALSDHTHAQKAARDQMDSQAVNAFPFLKDKRHPMTAAIHQLMDENPALAAFPGAKLMCAVYAQWLAAQKAPKQTEPAPTPKPQKQPRQSVVNPSRDQKAPDDLRKRAFVDGDPQSVREYSKRAFAGTLK